jgi:hypothetical protein
MMHEIIVGNIGIVYQGDEFREAHKWYSAYLLKSMQGVGRAAGEPLTWLQNGEVFEEYMPPQPPVEDTRRCPSCGRLLQRGIPMRILITSPRAMEEIREFDENTTHEDIEELLEGADWEVVYLDGTLAPDKILDLLEMVQEFGSFIVLDEDDPYYSYFVEE